MELRTARQYQYYLAGYRIIGENQVGCPVLPGPIFMNLGIYTYLI